MQVDVELEQMPMARTHKSEIGLTVAHALRCPDVDVRTNVDSTRQERCYGEGRRFAKLGNRSRHGKGRRFAKLGEQGDKQDGYSDQSEDGAD